MLPGLNAAAVGLIVAAVFSLTFQIYKASPFPNTTICIGAAGALKSTGYVSHGAINGMLLLMLHLYTCMAGQASVLLILALQSTVCSSKYKCVDHQTDLHEA